MTTRSIEQNLWARICAFAWKNPEVLNELRKDPKTTIQEIAKGENGKYKADSTTARQADMIRSQTETDATEPYEGYLPIPYAVGGLEKLSPEELKALLENGLTGVFRFDDRSDLWAEALHQAWNNPELLIKIRKDPLGNLPQADELKDSQYGIFPMPDLPEDLKTLSIEQLESTGAMTNVNGILPLACF